MIVLIYTYDLKNKPNRIFTFRDFVIRDFFSAISTGTHIRHIIIDIDILLQKYYVKKASIPILKIKIIFTK